MEIQSTKSTSSKKIVLNRTPLIKKKITRTFGGFLVVVGVAGVVEPAEAEAEAGVVALSAHVTTATTANSTMSNFKSMVYMIAIFN